MDIVTNTFCAGGNMLGDGTWINVGGNQPVKVSRSFFLLLTLSNEMNRVEELPI